MVSGFLGVKYPNPSPALPPLRPGQRVIIILQAEALHSLVGTLRSRIHYFSLAEVGSPRR